MSSTEAPEKLEKTGEKIVETAHKYRDAILMGLGILGLFIILVLIFHYYKKGKEATK